MANKENEEEIMEWRFTGNDKIKTASSISIRSILMSLMSSLNPNDPRPVIPLGHGDPSAFPCFRTTPVAEQAIIHSVQSANFNSYSPTVGILPARSAIAEYLSGDLPYDVSPDDVFLTVGCNQAIEVALTVLACPGANVLFPRPGFPLYETRAAFSELEVRHFDLLPEKGWEVDLEAVEALADENTVAMVVINPGNPTGSVYTYDHLKKIAETARRLGIILLADEVYDHLTFGTNPFVPMGVFGSIVPILTLGAISKRWLVPGWRLGWLVINDPNGILKKTKMVDYITGCVNLTSDPPTFIQGAVPDILKNTKEDFFNNTITLLRECADICYDGIKDNDYINCPHKPEGSMFVMVKLNTSLFEDISDDLDFCAKLSREESVIVMPGTGVGLKNWLRITFAVEPTMLKDGLERMKLFCLRHAAKQL